LRNISVNAIVNNIIKDNVMANDFSPYPRAIRPAPDPLALFHIGQNDHRQVLNMTAAGDFTCFGGVFDPTYLDRHKELLDQVLNHRLDAILDPKTQPSATPATGGLAHGVTQEEKFNTRSWRHPRSGSGFGSHPRIYLSQIDMLLKPADAEIFFDASPRTKGLFGCRDTKCCRRGIIDTLENPARHFLYQRIREVATLSQIPEQLRVQRFLDQHLLPTTNLALVAANINWHDEAMAKRTHEQRKRLDALRIALGNYELKRQKQSPAHLPKTRVSREAYM